MTDSLRRYRLWEIGCRGQPEQGFDVITASHGLHARGMYSRGLGVIKLNPVVEKDCYGSGKAGEFERMTSTVTSRSSFDHSRSAVRTVLFIARPSAKQARSPSDNPI